MNQEQHILEEYQENKISRSRLYMPVIILYSIFVLIVTVSTFFNLNNFTWAGLNVGFVNLCLWLIPVAGLFLMLGKQRAGWCISVAYFSFIIIFILNVIIKERSGDMEFKLDIFTARQLLIFILIIVLNSFLLTAAMRRQFSIPPSLMAGSVITGIFIALKVVTDN